MMTGTKLIIVATGILAGVMAHYGFPSTTGWWMWIPWRMDIPWWANFSIWWAGIMILWGFFRKD